jgi:integrase
MAYIAERGRTNGTIAYQVRWRLDGSRSGKAQQQTFDTWKAARAFQKDVEGHGHTWPPGWVPGRRGSRGSAALALHMSELTEGFLRQLTGVEDDTRNRYRQQLQQIVGDLGDPPVAGVSSQMVGEWVNTCLSAGWAPKTVANYHGIWFSAMQHACVIGLRGDNPCAGTRLMRRRGRAEVCRFLTEHEFGQLRAAAPRDSEALLVTAVGTGLRWGELTALHAGDLVTYAGAPALHVKRAWKKADDGSLRLGAPKTRSSTRSVTLAEPIAARLHEICAGKGPGDLIFTAPRGGHWSQPTFYRRRWVPILEAAGRQDGNRRLRFHDLRHTHAAWLISAGVPLPVVQHRLGHASITTTVDLYGGLLAQAHVAADNAIERALRGEAVQVHALSVPD